MAGPKTRSGKGGTGDGAAKKQGGFNTDTSLSGGGKSGHGIANDSVIRSAKSGTGDPSTSKTGSWESANIGADSRPRPAPGILLDKAITGDTK